MIMNAKKKSRNVFAFPASPAWRMRSPSTFSGSPSLSRPDGREPCQLRLANPQKRYAISFCIGASLLETVLYIGIFAIIALLTVNTVLALTRAVGEIRGLRHTIRDADIAMERMIREIRAAQNVDTGTSVLGSNPGTLVLAGTSSTITFSLLGGEQIFLQKNAESPRSLTSSSTRITNLVFTRLVASSSEAARIQMTMDNKNFYGTAVLRGSY